jgi:hypothetical protein
MDGMMRKMDREGADKDVLMPVIANWKSCLGDLLDDRNRTDRTNRAYRL